MRIGTILSVEAEVATVWGPGPWAILCHLANHPVILRKPETRALMVKLTQRLAQHITTCQCQLHSSVSSRQEMKDCQP